MSMTDVKIGIQEVSTDKIEPVSPTLVFGFAPRLAAQDIGGILIGGVEDREGVGIRVIDDPKFAARSLRAALRRRGSSLFAGELSLIETRDAVVGTYPMGSDGEATFPDAVPEGMALVSIVGPSPSEVDGLIMPVTNNP